MADENITYDFLILGAGAAGMMAAIACGEYALAAGRAIPRIALLEKNKQAGIKVLVCGGGRCNLTNAGNIDFLIAQFGRNGRFLTPALQALDNTALRKWFAHQDVPTHEEHDGKIYPDSNQASSVVNAMVRRIRELQADIFAPCPATAVAWDASCRLFTLQTQTHQTLKSKYLLLAAGGQSYTRMGTTGDGYRFAESLGHTLITPRPAIVPLLCKEPWIGELQGLAVPDVTVRIALRQAGVLPRLATGKPEPSINDLMFTHFGLSGPAVLNISEIAAELLEKFPEILLRIDFSRHHSHEALAAMLRKWHDTEGKKLVRTRLAELIPQRLAEMFCRLEHIDQHQACANLTARQIQKLVERIKASSFTVYETRGFKEAMVTAGGVRLDEVFPATMQSRVNSQLFLAGEVLDLTGPSGGYNLQLAFSTGHLAGSSVARYLMGDQSHCVP
jgi:predicted Rossmann fold flavoprotein